MKKNKTKMKKKTTVKKNLRNEAGDRQNRGFYRLPYVARQLLSKIGFMLSRLFFQKITLLLI